METTYPSRILPAIPELPDLVQLNLLTSLLFAAIAFILFLFIIYSRFRDGVRFRKRRWMDKKAQQFITSYLFNADELTASHLESFRQKYITNAFQRYVFIENLLKLHRNITGESSDRLRTLYQSLGLHAYAKQKLYTSSWAKNANGICELAEMGMKQDVELIRAFINHSHPVLRSEAQIALVHLQNEAPFSFLDELEEPLMEWQQMQLARAAQKADSIKIPAFSQWLQKDEDTIVMFCIRMIEHYNQYDAVADLLKLLDHPSALIRKETVVALRNLGACEAAEKLLQIYGNEQVTMRQEILKTLALIAGDELLTFYNNQLHDSDKGVQFEAARAMAQCGARGNELISIIKNNPQHGLQPVAAYTLEPTT
ncbi:HEAT repeat domain-containing protein [Pontibacter sp. 172403-2]|uniref:HEAT repeat domain-containing protein n=1 Tax=Pontibacter rufus TaxID=2791028 RepID=UPI0018AFBE3E|nr:HEAT repeat domain-containing protein [Pontibacter sp. 172403-2]MBF9254523.1 HEAT repeat domain-containing protein [Pontibacter sp. 172403-2]